MNDQTELTIGARLPKGSKSLAFEKHDFISEGGYACRAMQHREKFMGSWWTGYVELPEGHPLRGIRDVSELYRRDPSIELSEEITYARDGVLGFDTHNINYRGKNLHPADVVEMVEKLAAELHTLAVA